jgi:hypothetical protein
MASDLFGVPCEALNCPVSSEFMSVSQRQDLLTMAGGKHARLVKGMAFQALSFERYP